MDFNNNIDYYIKLVGYNIRRIMKQKGLDQSELKRRSVEMGCPVSQGTISTVIQGKGNVTLANLIKLAAALDTDITELLGVNGKERELVDSTLKNDGLLISDPADPAFKGYMGEYNIYFYKTTGKELELVYGTLQLKASDNAQQCLAELSLFTGDAVDINQQKATIRKLYYGNLVISTSMHSVYCFLYGKEIGELCFLVFHHWYLLHNDLKCAMASAATISSGSNRRPTVHRVCLSREEVGEEKLAFLKGQLLMNDANILISQTEWNKALKDERIPEEFRELMEQAAQKEKYVLIKESNVISEAISEYEQIKWISYLRSLSISPKYNKISMRTDEALFRLLYPEA